MSEPYLTITPLGGLGEIGMNCQKWQTDQGVVLIDCGLMFPDDALLGVDVVIPRLESVFAEGEKVLGIVLTHGHEDHIGALPWLLLQYKSLRGIRICIRRPEVFRVQMRAIYRASALGPRFQGRGCTSRAGSASSRRRKPSIRRARCRSDCRQSTSATSS